MKKFKIANIDLNTPEDREIFKKKFSARLSDLFKEYKEKNNCSDAYIYNEVLQIGKTTYYNWKNPDKDTLPDFANLIDLQKIFEVPIDYIMCVSDKKSRSHIETDLSIKKMCDLTQLNKSAVLMLCDNSYVSMEIKSLLNYLLDAPPEIQRILKAIMVKDNSIKHALLSEDEKENLSKSEKKEYLNCLNKMQTERNRLLFTHSQAMDKLEKEKNPYINKDRFLTYLYDFIFTKLEHTFTYMSGEDTKGVEIKNLVFYDESLLVAQTMQTNPSDFEKLFLDNAVSYLQKIKDYYLKHDYDKEKLKQQKMDAVNEEINSLFYNT